MRCGGFRSVRWPYLLTGVLTLSGCEVTVALGGECLPLGQACREIRDPVIPRDADAGDEDGDGKIVDPLDDAGAATDAETPDLDGGQVSDGALDASSDGAASPGDAALPVLFPSLRNMSFELQNGSSPGDFGATLSNTDISPWYNCQAPGGSSLRVEEQVGDVLPTDGSAFMAFQYPYWADLPVPVYQTIEQPLRKGQPYAFMVDVRAEGVGADGMVALGVRGGRVRCSAVYTLVNTDYLPSGRWESRCIRFTPTEDMSELSLVPVVKGVIAVTFRLYVDNLREDPSCQ